MKVFLLFLSIFLTNTAIAQDTLVDMKAYKVFYSQTKQQPIWVEYKVQCKNPKRRYDRKLFVFRTIRGIKTSDAEDYIHNNFDKGHLAPAENFVCDSILLKQSFSYLNCALQNEKLNKGVWKSLEIAERKMGDSVEILVETVFSDSSVLLNTCALVPDGFKKTICIKGEIKEIYYFPNVEPIHNDYKKYRTYKNF